MPLAISVVPSIGSTATSQPRALAVADLLAVEQHGRLVLLALADHDDAAHRDGADELAHRVDGRAVAAVLVAAPDPAAGGHRGRLGDPDELHGEVAVGRLAAPFARGWSRSRTWSSPASSCWIGGARGPWSGLRGCPRSSQTAAATVPRVTGRDERTPDGVAATHRRGRRRRARCDDGPVSSEPDPPRPTVAPPSTPPSFTPPPLAKPPRSALTVRDMLVALAVLVAGDPRARRDHPVLLVRARPGRPSTRPAPRGRRPGRAAAGCAARPFPVRVPAVPPDWRSNSVGQDLVDGRPRRPHRVPHPAGPLPAAAAERRRRGGAARGRDRAACRWRARGTVDVGGQRWVVYGPGRDEPIWVAEVTSPTARPLRLLITGSGTEAGLPGAGRRRGGGRAAGRSCRSRARRRGPSHAVPAPRPAARSQRRARASPRSQSATDSSRPSPPVSRARTTSASSSRACS